jgi:hypothetical protein
MSVGVSVLAIGIWNHVDGPPVDIPVGPIANQGRIPVSPEENIVVYVVARFCLAGSVLLMTLGKSKRLLAGIVMLWLVQVVPAQVAPDSEWPNYGNDPGGTQYSIAWQINRTNVNRLQLAWT